MRATNRRSQKEVRSMEGLVATSKVAARKRGVRMLSDRFSIPVTIPQVGPEPYEGLGISAGEKYTALPCCLARLTISSAPTDGPPTRRQPSHLATRRREIG